MTSCVCSEFSAPLKNFEEVLERLDVGRLISKSLEFQYIHARSGVSVWMCSACGADWAEERPFPETHGSGPSCFFQISSPDRNALSREYRGEILEWRKTFEDEHYLDSLGSEIGPEKCSDEACHRLRVAGSSKCRRHHFKMIRGYESNKPD